MIRETADLVAADLGAAPIREQLVGMDHLQGDRVGGLQIIRKGGGLTL